MVGGLLIGNVSSTRDGKARRLITLLEKAHANAAEIQRAGLIALEDARRAGVPAYYIDRSLGEGIIREMPDGTRQRLILDGGREVVAEVFGPRA